MKRFTLLALALAAGSVMAAQPKGDIAKGKEIATNICAACHAADGNSGIAMYPKLSAQFPNYIFHQTKAIKEGKRTTGAAASMAPMVMGLSDQDIADVSAFYAKQFPKAGEANPKDNFELGARIFRGGLADKKVPACMACHGPNGAGMTTLLRAILGLIGFDGQVLFPFRRAEPRECLGHLHTDRAAARNKQPAGQRRQREQVFVGQVGDRVDPIDGGAARA